MSHLASLSTTLFSISCCGLTLLRLGCEPEREQEANQSESVLEQPVTVDTAEAVLREGVGAKGAPNDPELLGAGGAGRELETDGDPNVQ